VRSTPQSLLRPVLRRAPPVEPGTKTSEDLDHVPDQIVGDLAVVDDHQAAPMGRQSSLHQFGVHAGQAVSVLDHDG